MENRTVTVLTLEGLANSMRAELESSLTLFEQRYQKRIPRDFERTRFVRSEMENSYVNISESSFISRENLLSRIIDYLASRYAVVPNEGDPGRGSSLPRPEYDAM
jgi:hypothetical protein